jgi:hypothetical protein
VHGAFKGLLLGALNVLVIAIGLAGIEHASIASLVIVIGGGPGLVAGFVLGLIAQAIDHVRVPIRIAVLALPAVGLVFLLARIWGMDGAAPISCIPTLVATLILERWTRKRPAPPPVPIARVN